MMSVTDLKGDGLSDMAEGLMTRHVKSNVLPPKVLYINCDGCSTKIK